RTTRRWPHLTALCARGRVVCASATPVDADPRALNTLLSLFLGARAAALTASDRARVIVRTRDTVRGAPRVITPEPLALPRGPRVVGAITGIARRAEPPTSRALLRAGLLLAASAGLATLDARLRRLVQRAAATSDDAIVDEESVQQGFALGASTASVTIDDVAVVRVRALRAQIAPAIAADRAARAHALLVCVARHTPAPVVAFAQHEATIRAYAAALRGSPGVVRLSGRGGRIASGAIARDEVIAALSHGGVRDAHPRMQIRLVLATDVLSEGIDLTGAAAVVHLDTPWTAGRRAQRTGRLARPGNPHATVYEYTLAIDGTVGHALAFATRQARTHAHARAATAPSRGATAVRQLLRSWRRSDAPAVRPIGAVVARGTEPTHLLVVQQGEERRIVRVTDRAISEAPHHVLGALRALTGEAIALDHDAARRALRTYRDAAGTTSAIGAMTRPLGVARRRWVRILDRALATATSTTRRREQARAGLVRAALLRPTRATDDIVAPAALPASASLTQVLGHLDPILTSDATDDDVHRDAPPARLRALLQLVPQGVLAHRAARGDGGDRHPRRACDPQALQAEGEVGDRGDAERSA
ncbi:MAG: hypothetical protein K2X99_01725, partial [Gemmatimonadaceae bacterium]|nr:hypothetical protein [Gemmatimonadaceae bacterium]